MKAREYQSKAFNLMKKAFCDGHKKIMLFMATGSGKGFIFQQISKNSISKGNKTLLVMRRRSLIFQSKKRMESIGIKSSVIMGSEKGFNPDLNMQICSIDTITRRNNIDFLYNFDVVIVDECHDCTSNSYKKFLDKFSKKTTFIGLTASPFPVGSKVHDFWDCCVKPIEVHELVKQGFLTECSIFLPGEIDLNGIKTVAGDYHQGQLADTMSQLEIIGDVVESYKRFGNNMAAICFAVNKEHSIKLCMEFNEQGIPAVHCDESTNQKDRDAAIEKLRTGKIKVLCNVNIFSTGVDIPEAIVGIMARPTQSEVLYIQQIGRLLRPYRKCGKCSTGYDNSDQCPICGYDKPSFIKGSAIIIDNGNNIERHGHPFKVRHPVLKKEDIKKRKEDDVYEFKIKNCKECFAAYSAHLQKCPECGYSNEKVQRTIKKKDGQIVPYDEFSAIRKKLLDYEKIKLEKGLKPNFPYFKIYEDFGDLVYEYEGLNIPKWVANIVKKNQIKEQRNIYQ